MQYMDGDLSTKQNPSMWRIHGTKAISCNFPLAAHFLHHEQLLVSLVVVLAIRYQSRRSLAFSPSKSPFGRKDMDLFDVEFDVKFEHLKEAIVGVVQG